MHEEAKADVFDHTDCFYNPKRQHSSLDTTGRHGLLKKTEAPIQLVCFLVTCQC